MINKGPCSNCGEADWAAKNNDYCDSCEHEYVAVLRRVVCIRPNPIQSLVDIIFEGEVRRLTKSYVNWCPYNDCGWCYSKDKSANDTHGACNKPKECAVLDKL